MLQRVMIAMALSCQPKLLIADEPTTALDVTVQAQILRLLRDRAQARRMAMMLITHDLGVIAQMAEQVVVMYAGRVVEQARRPRSAPPAASLYPGADRLAPGARRATPSPVLNSRPGAGSRRPARRLRLCRPLPAGQRSLPPESPSAIGNNAAGRLLSHPIRGAGCMNTESHEYVIEVEGLKTLSAARGLFGQQTGQLRAVDGVSFRIRQGPFSAWWANPAAGKRPWAHATGAIREERR
jgi:ABC-type glutathione transport system ATPase component